MKLPHFSKPIIPATLNTGVRPDNKGFWLALFATILAFCVVVLGAYTRLTDAGLGCPDWPGCYGHILISKSTPELTNLNQITKAWTEMTHRYLAGFLGLVIFALAFLSIKNRNLPNQPILLPISLAILVVFQALLGMWTVTLKLFPIVVIAHLLGGLITLSLLWLLCLKLKLSWNPVNQLAKILNNSNTQDVNNKDAIIENFSFKILPKLRFWASISLIILVFQLFLGGWTSANYAALVCPDFPLCHSQSFFSGNFSEAFNLTSAGINGSPGNPLNYQSRVAIHMMHRIGALFSAIAIGWLAFQIFMRSQSFIYKLLSVAMATLLIIQILLGITNVLALLPLSVAVAHNAVAALLLLSLVTVNYYLFFNSKKVLWS